MDNQVDRRNKVKTKYIWENSITVREEQYVQFHGHIHDGSLDGPSGALTLLA